MNEVTIEDNVRIPRPKYAVRDEDRRRKIFNAFANAYAALYVRRPDRWSFDKTTKLMTVYVGDSVAERAGEQRLKELTRMMRNKVAER